MRCFHINDSPADPPRRQMSDAHRGCPGNSVAALPELLAMMHSTGFRGVLSLELFNREYWQGPTQVVADAGIAKMKETFRRTMALLG